MTRDNARAMVDGWQCLHFFPSKDAALTATIDAILNAVKSREHAAAFNATILRRTDFPAPGDIYQAATETAPERKAIDCPICDGTGWAPACDGVARCQHVPRVGPKAPDLTPEELASWKPEVES